MFRQFLLRVRPYRKDGKDRHGEDVDVASAYQYNPEVFDEE